MMKKIIFMGFVITFLIAAIFVKADQVNMDISVNGTSNLNITVNADDTLARQMASQTQSELNGTQSDIYGSMHNSGPKDMVLDEIKRGYGNPINGTQNLDSIKEICNDAYLQNYLNQIGGLPPIDFVNYVKALGYDDEAHINFIWTICQQQYTTQHQAQWSEDTGIKSAGDLANIFEDVINYLTTGQKTIYSGAENIAIALDSYFASKRDVWFLSNKVKELDIRVEALEKTMEKIAPEAYCQGKLDLMKEYNLSGVKCGENSTYYWNAKKAGFDNYDVIAYTSCTENWTCSDWSGCINGIQGRYCVDKNNCGSFDSKPLVARECKVVEQQQQQMVKAVLSEQVQNNKELVVNKNVEKGNTFFLDALPKLILILAGGFLLTVLIKICFDANSHKHNRKSVIKENNYFAVD